jgi:glycosyltransferase involved in cell wall biosynthesis
MTSDHEGLPMILLEAMAAETLIISHPVGGIPILLNHGECGILIGNNNETEYAQKIKTIASNLDIKSKAVGNALSRVRYFYSSQTSTKAYYAEYKSIIPKYYCWLTNKSSNSDNNRSFSFSFTSCK